MEYQQAIGKAIVFIENHLNESIKASDVAGEVDYSYYHFHRYFSAVMGESIGSYIRSRRLTQAAWELVHTEKRVLDIGLSFYFESAESFARAFKSRYGITPTAYRKNGVDTLISSRKPIPPNKIDLLKYSDLKPEITMISSTHILGIRFETSIDENCSVSMWEKLNQQITVFNDPQLSFCRRYEIYEVADSCSAQSFGGDCSINAFIGMEYPGKSKTDYGLQEKELSEGKYAKFVHVGTVDTLLNTYQYIWSVWFPKSGYELAEQDDFECYTERFLGPNNPNSQIDIYFPVK
ncbi:MAG: AraC family transcriptional regulator [Lachnospiraceae bacterium]|nr:AraC family transcriptional regulator [Lachnospiraceae bacterium]